MGGSAAVYWLAVATIVYAYLGYPALLAWIARRRSRPVRRGASTGGWPTVSVVLPARNERASVVRRVGEFIDAIGANGLIGEILVVSDGSTDGTAEAARAFEGGPVPVHVIEFAENVGKAWALTTGCLEARNEVLIFADTRQTWADDAVVRLLENFDDPEVGAAGGQLVVESAPGVMAGVGLYWRYETWLRRTEGSLHSTVGLSGSISAVRRELFRPIPPGTILDDVYWPLSVVMQGRRVVFDGRAKAFDRLPDQVSSEFRRKVRTLAGNFQLVARLPRVLSPWHNPIWLPFLSHKLFRLAVPWAMLAALVIAPTLGGPVYGALALVQVAGLAVGLAGLSPSVARRSRLASTAGSLLVLNAAAWVAFWVWVTGRSSRAWTPTAYRPATAVVSAPSLEEAFQ